MFLSFPSEVHGCLSETGTIAPCNIVVDAFFIWRPCLLSNCPICMSGLKDLEKRRQKAVYQHGHPPDLHLPYIQIASEVLPLLLPRGAYPAETHQEGCP